jgi:hypothetical protein
MTLDQFTSKLEAKMTAMSDEELMASLRKVGCKFLDDSVVESFWNEDAFEVGWSAAANSNDLALAA